MLDAAGSVVERHGLDLRVPTEEVAALFQGDGMRISPAQVTASDSWRRDQIVHDAQAEFLLDENLARQQQIEMLGHGTSQRILDGDDCGGNGATFQAVE